MFSLLILGASTALVAEADARNMDYVNCIFATARGVSVELDDSVFVERWEASCVEERGAFQRAFIEVHMERGDSPEEAEARWSGVQQRGLNRLLDTRRNIRELQG